jgi:hypothetical protein
MAQALQSAPASVLDADSILAIHRHDDGRIAIQRKHGGGWEPLWSLTPADLRGTFRTFQDWLLDNAYFSTQAYYRAAPAGWTHKPTGLPAIGVDKHRPEGSRRFGRVTENLSYLNCLSCDIDCGRTPAEAKDALQAVPWRDAQRRIEDLQDAGLIPAISLMGYSGRGLYVIWLLHDDQDATRSAPAYAHHIPTWKAIQKALIHRLERTPLPVDHAGSLITQVYRIGGSKHPGGNKARYFVYAQADKERKLISYTLHELAAYFDIHTTQGELPEQTRSQVKLPTYRKVQNPGSAPLRSNGYKRRHALIAQDLLTLERHYGGWRKRGTEYPGGHRTPKYGRRLLLRLYAQAIIRSMYSPRELWPPAEVDTGTQADILRRMEDMATNCVPVYGSDGADKDPPIGDILQAVLSEYKHRKLPPTPSTKTLCAALGVSAEMAIELELKTIRPPEVAAAADMARPTQDELIERRREFARQYLKLWPRTTARKLAEAYKREGFTGANHETANQDLNHLGYEVRTPGRRRRLDGR